MNKNLTMVVPRDLLLEKPFQGFRGPGDVDYEALILNNFEYRPRDRVEDDPGWKQPIAYALLVNPELKLLFAYRRAESGERYPEKRLQGKWSWGVGGHIDKADLEGGNPIRISLAREIREELGNLRLSPAKVLGYINDDSDPVGRVHFGILYLIKTAEKEIRPLSPEISSGGLKPLEEIADLLRAPEIEVEQWSALALPPLMDLIREWGIENRE